MVVLLFKLKFLGLSYLRVWDRDAAVFRFLGIEKIEKLFIKNIFDPISSEFSYLFALLFYSNFRFFNFGTGSIPSLGSFCSQTH